MLRWEVFPSTDAPSSDGRSLQPAVQCFMASLLLQPKMLVILPKWRFASAVVMGSWSLGDGCGCFLLQNHVLRVPVDCHQQVAAFMVINRVGDLEKHPQILPCAIFPTWRCPTFPSSPPPASLLWMTLGKAGGIRD